MTEGKLFVVATPIGNLGDMTHRSIEVLKGVDVILAEDTRTTGLLLKHYGISSKMESYHMHNEHRKVSGLLERLDEGLNIALVSDAGTPGISDPGFLLVREARKKGLEVSVLPGATAFIPALIQSGFPTDRFVFEGFLPQKKGRRTRLLEVQHEKRTIVFYESPHRILKLLSELNEIFGDARFVSVSRELTKKFEETVNGTPEAVAHYFKKKDAIKGEFVVVVESAGNEKTKK